MFTAYVNFLYYYRKEINLKEILYVELHMTEPKLLSYFYKIRYAEYNTITIAFLPNNIPKK